MDGFAEFAKWLACELLGHDISVKFYDGMNGMACACYCRENSELAFNVKILGRRWFEAPIAIKHIDLLIHEFGHDFEGNHLTNKYHCALTELAGRLAFLAAAKPERFLPIDVDPQGTVVPPSSLSRKGDSAAP
jgi:hypothetical protein